MSEKLNRATNIGLLTNVFLFVIKGVVGILSNSIAVISEALNSLTDIISSLAIRYAVKLSREKPDEKHQFGHNAAQPIAAFIVAVFAFVLGINIVEESIKRIIDPAELDISLSVYLVLVVTIVAKIFLSIYQHKIGKKFSSPALRAASIDSVNDILTSAVALIGVICVSLGYDYIDGVAGIFVAFFIFKTGYEVGKESVDYLMGKAADKKLIVEVIKKTLSVEAVKGFNDVRSYYVGDKFHIEMHIEVNRNLSTEASHDIGKVVEQEIESLDQVQKAFIHIDPV